MPPPAPGIYANVATEAATIKENQQRCRSRTFRATRRILLIFLDCGGFRGDIGIKFPGAGGGIFRP